MAELLIVGVPGTAITSGDFAKPGCWLSEEDTWGGELISGGPDESDKKETDGYV
jgi:hypothetical protein